MIQLSHPCVTTGKAIALTFQTFTAALFIIIELRSNQDVLQKVNG